MPKITNDDIYPVVTPAATDRLVITQGGVVKKALVGDVGGGSGETVEINDTDTTINLTTADLNKVLRIENASPVVINLPSVAAAQVGSGLKVRKRGVGSVTINAADSDTIADGSSTTVVDSSTDTDSGIDLILETATEWGLGGLPLGNWSTS